GLVSEVLEDAIERAGASRLREARAEADARESITHWLTTLCEFWAADFELFANIISVAPTDPEIRAITDAYDYRRREALREMAGRLEEQGYLRSDVTPDHAGDVLWVLSSLAAFDHLYRRSNMTVPEVAQTIMDMTAHLL